ncbi:hypothetical protein PACTADRAFT_50540 [Pachysolen tannophilus NRRL Y-2460]|uniref:DNA polymerase epsilon subunit B n=1 Tax=Pachysolen tannophilus NRRL Y-2460 TaxID=669874 RepID=A0A1E4TSM9_PACTA|nr:hypothetical protein PACTADRAFT_50540 [Pachysolen tannophilus NRRL Y-2460]
MDVPASKPIQLSVQLHASNLRPIAYRILSKKHGLNIQTEALKILANYIGTTFGNNWKGAKAQEFLDSLGKLWKEQGRNIFLDAEGVETVIRELNYVSENYHLKSQIKDNVSGSIIGHGKKLELSDLIRTVDDRNNNGVEIYKDDNIHLESKKDEEIKNDDLELKWMDFFRVITSGNQPRYIFNKYRKTYEKDQMMKNDSDGLIRLPSLKSNISLFSTRYSIIQHRLSRNQSFQPPTFSSLNSINLKMSTNSGSNNIVITPIKNLLGRHGQRFVLFGLLFKNNMGGYSLQDESDIIQLEISQCIPTEGSYYCPGFFVVVEGIYSNSGKFYVSTMGHPPAERRDITLDAYGNIDFLGVHSTMNNTNKNLTSTSANGITRVSKELKKKLQILEKELFNHKLIILGGDCNLNDFKTFEGLKKLFLKLSNDLEYNNDYNYPFCIVFNGPFIDIPFVPSSYNSTASAASSSSSAIYKNLFDTLASTLEKFPILCEKISLLFIPGDNDPWNSLLHQGSSSIFPQSPIPKIFTNRLSRLVKNCYWCSNPTRLNYLSQEILIVRDDLSARFRRNNLLFPINTTNYNGNGKENEDPIEVDDLELETPNLTQLTNKDKNGTIISPSLLESRKIVKTILDQGHLSPFALNIRPITWDKDFYLTMSPLPTVLILTDVTCPSFDVTYEGCHTINPGKFMVRNHINYVEYTPSLKKAEFKQI